MREVGYLTTGRYDMSPMKSVLEAIRDNENLKLHLYATGMHLMKDRGMTINDVEKDFPMVQRVKETPSGNDRISMARFGSRLSGAMVDILAKDNLDAFLILGDRQEMLSVAAVAYQIGIPIAHLHGGERTSTDDSARHAITKLSSLHFPATEESAERLIRLGEKKERIHVVGAPALDTILNTPLPSKKETLDFLGLKSDKYILVTQHPCAGEETQAGDQMENVLNAVLSFNYSVVVIYPNIDAGASHIIRIIRIIDKKARESEKLHCFGNIPFSQFLATEKFASCWVGNSSAQMIESSSFGIPVVNVGSRQDGRQRGGNVIDVGYRVEEIVKAVQKSLTDIPYQQNLKNLKNPWGDGKTGQRVAKILESVKLEGLLDKQISY